MSNISKSQFWCLVHYVLAYHYYLESCSSSSSAVFMVNADHHRLLGEIIIAGTLKELVKQGIVEGLWAAEMLSDHEALFHLLPKILTLQPAMFKV